MVFLFCCVEKWNESATSEEEQVKSEHPEENGAADISAVCEANALTLSPQFQEEYRKIFLFSFLNLKKSI